MWFETMQFHMGATSDWLIRALNSDIVRENRMACECMDWAIRLAHLTEALVRKQLLACAAAAMCNATLLASEVISLGGAPPQLQPPEAPAVAEPLETKEAVASARRLVQHYRDRTRMAEKLGLPGLREVFREIVRSKTHYLAHARMVAMMQNQAPAIPAGKAVTRIAVPTDDGKSIARRLRRSAAFLIFEAQDGAIRNCGLRANHGRASALSGCDVVLCASVGSRAAAALRARGVFPVFVPAGAGAEETVAAYVSGAMPNGLSA